MMEDIPEVEAKSVEDDDAQLPGNGALQTAPPQAPPRASRKNEGRLGKRVSWQDDVTTGPAAVNGKSSHALPLDTAISIPEISNLWFPQDEVDSGKVHREPANDLERVQFKVRSFVDKLGVRVAGIILILLDIIMVIIDLSIPEKSPSSQLMFDSVAMTLSCVFMIDLMARIFSYGCKEFFTNRWEVVDGLIVVITFLVTVLYTALDSVVSAVDEEHYAKLIVFARLLRIVRFVRIFYAHRQTKKSTRKTISMNKRRYQKDGFDLDLTYVTERVIAMSFPSSGLQSIFRNPIKQVSLFFKTKHPGKYRIYNLCSERSYDESFFEGQCYRMMIDDHNVPSMSGLLEFIDDVQRWMSEDEENVIAVHCKGGKGRTGTAVCAWLLACDKFDNSKESLEYFGGRRTDMEVGTTFQGVETASQIRYVGYFERIKKEFGGKLPPEKTVRITKVVISSIAGVGRGNGSDLSMQIFVKGQEVLMCKFAEDYNCKVQHKSKENSVSCDVSSCPSLTGDVKIRFTSSARNLPRGYDNCAFYFWVNTSFLEGDRVTIHREEIDNPHKKKTWHIYQEDFAVELNYEELAPYAM